MWAAWTAWRYVVCDGPYYDTRRPQSKPWFHEARDLEGRSGGGSGVGGPGPGLVGGVVRGVVCGSGVGMRRVMVMMTEIMDAMARVLPTTGGVT